MQFGRRKASCKARDLTETAPRAAQCAKGVGAKSWDIMPATDNGIQDPLVIVKFYDRADFGLCTFPPEDAVGIVNLDYATGEIRSRAINGGKPKMYWWDELPQPHWLDIENGVYDKTHGYEWTPELQG